MSCNKISVDISSPSSISHCSFPLSLEHLSRMIKKKPTGAESDPRAHLRQAVAITHLAVGGSAGQVYRQTGHTLVLTQLPLSGTHGLHHPDGQGGLQHGYPHVCKADGACREGGVLVSFCLHSVCDHFKHRPHERQLRDCTSMG